MVVIQSMPNRFGSAQKSPPQKHLPFAKCCIIAGLKKMPLQVPGEVRPDGTQTR